MSWNDPEMIKWGKNDNRPRKVIIMIIFIILRPFKHLFMLLGSLRYLRISGWNKMRIEWGRNDGFLWGKAAHFCPTPPLVPTSFGGHSKSSFPSGMTQNDLWTRNGTQMTGMKNGNDCMSPIVLSSFFDVRYSFLKEWGSFWSPSCHSVERGQCLIPSHSEMKRPCNEKIFIFESFHSQLQAGAPFTERHRKDIEDGGTIRNT